MTKALTLMAVGSLLFGVCAWLGGSRLLWQIGRRLIARSLAMEAARAAHAAAERRAKDRKS